MMMMLLFFTRRLVGVVVGVALLVGGQEIRLSAVISGAKATTQELIEGGAIFVGDAENVTLKADVCGGRIRSMKFSLFSVEADGTRRLLEERTDAAGELPPSRGFYDFERGASYEFRAEAQSVSAEVTFSVERAVVKKLTAGADADYGDRFGDAVAISGNIVVVGALDDNDVNNFDTGSVYVFRSDENEWLSVAKLTADDAAEDAHFGRSLAIDGDTIVVGSLLNSEAGEEAGSVYVFQTSDDGVTWTQVAKLTADDGEAYDFFGQAVAISSNIIVVGSYHDDDAGFNSGSVYVFQDLEQVAKLTADDASGGTNQFQGSNNGDNFGTSVAIAGDTIVVGSPEDDNGQGSAYVFQKKDGSWTQVAKLIADDASSYYRFGSSVAIDNDTIVVGSPDHNIGGSAYVFQDDGDWRQVARLVADDAAEMDYFGVSVAVSDQKVVVGSWFDDDQGFNSGSAYVFSLRSDFPQVAKLTVADGAPTDRFGKSVAIADNKVVVGAADDDDVATTPYYYGFNYYITGSNSGAAYVFNV